jgi:hypothetical protein
MSAANTANERLATEAGKANFTKNIDSYPYEFTTNH